MKYRQVTERIGELLGPVDWSYDFASHDWEHGGCCNPECVKQGVECLRRIEAGEVTHVYRHGSVYEVIAHGMYDGWPYWKPTPSAMLKTWLGGEWHAFMDLQPAPQFLVPKQQPTTQAGRE